MPFQTDQMNEMGPNLPNHQSRTENREILPKNLSR